MSINDIFDKLSVAEASEILCRLQDAEISVSVPECNKDVAEDNLTSGDDREPIIYPGQKVTVIVLNKEKYRGVALSYLSKDDDIIPVLILDDTAMTGSGRFIIDKFSLCDMELGWEEETE